MGGKNPIITGPDTDPVVSLFDAGFKGVLACRLWHVCKH